MLLPALFGLVLLLSVGSSSASVSSPPSTSRTSFTKQQVCPATDKLALLDKLVGAQDRRTCFVECATSASCSVLYRSGGICYFGTGDHLANFFTLTASPNPDPCESYTKGVWSKLVVLFDFRQAFTNLVSPGTFDATPRGGVSRDAQGAHFSGNKADYIEVDTQSGLLVTRYLDDPKMFSFYAKVVRQTYYQASCHCFYNCINDNSERMAYFSDRDGRAWVQHQFLSLTAAPDSVETRQSAKILSSHQPMAVSMGAAFHGKTLNNFYFNGSNLPTESDLNWGTYDQPKCLRLGYHKEDGGSLKGRMICYAIAKSALSTAEFQQLDQICS